MNCLFLISSLFVLAITSVDFACGDDPRMRSLSTFCEKMQQSIADGSFLNRQKVRDDCAAKAFSIDQVKAIKTCQAIIPMETPADVKKVCGDIATYETKFTEVRTCFRNNRPSSSAKQQFKSCISSTM